LTLGSGSVRGCSTMGILRFTVITRESREPLDAALERLVIAGWTGRDRVALEAHIQELGKLGIPRPKSTPLFYRTSRDLLTGAPSIQVVGAASSGEVEPVLLSLSDGLHLGVGSDHTDRKLETLGVTVSKQMCAKPLGGELWRFEEVAEHWDRLLMRSFAIVGHERRLYQEGALEKLRHPADLIGLYLGQGQALPVGTVMFCGTLPVHGEVQPADAYELELEDPVLGRRICHRYAVDTLPIEG